MLGLIDETNSLTSNTRLKSASQNYPYQHKSTNNMAEEKRQAKIREADEFIRDKVDKTWSATDIDP